MSRPPQAQNLTEKSAPPGGVVSRQKGIIMTVQELIEALQVLMDDYGNMPVIFRTPVGVSDDEDSDVMSVYYDDDTEKIVISDDMMV